MLKGYMVRVKLGTSALDERITAVSKITWDEHTIFQKELTKNRQWGSMHFAD